jgi:hypothetical protein
MEQFIILLVIGAIAVIKWMLEKSAELREKNRTQERIEQLERDNPPAPPILAPRPVAIPNPDIDIDAAARRLRKALGLPDEDDLPTFRRPVIHPDPLPVQEVEGAPMTDLEQRVVVSPPPLPLTRKPLPSRPAAKVPEVAGPAMRSRLDELLKSREGLRSAILAQEILGTPKGLVF